MCWTVDGIAHDHENVLINIIVLIAPAEHDPEWNNFEEEEEEIVIKKPVGAQKRKRKYTRRVTRATTVGNKKVPKVVIKKSKPLHPIAPAKPKGKHSSLEERQLVIDLMLSGKFAWVSSP